MLFVYLSLLVVCGGALGGAGARDKPHYPESAHAQLFAEFKAAYSKQYASPQEERFRFIVFKKNLAKINELNAKSGETFYAINQFADLTPEEFKAQYTGLKVDSSETPVPPPLTNLSIAAPAAFDWRDKGVVTRVKNQAGCGSCWAFATIGSLESNYARKTGQLQEFSEQQLVDCDTSSGDGGCNGGLPSNACGYLQQSGSMTETDYPYTAMDGSCAYDAGKVVTHSTDCTNHAGSAEEDIKQILVNKGPMAIALDASLIKYYGGGVITDCAHYDLDHAVLLVGYGTDHWIIKNSWDTTWGEKGYFRIQMGVNCLGFTTRQVVPVEV